MLSEDTKILEFNQFQKSDKAAFIIYAHLDCIIVNKCDVYAGKDCVKKLCELLRKHTMKIINSKNKKMKLLTKQQ